MHMYTLHVFKIISCELTGYNTNISTDEVEWDRLNKFYSNTCYISLA